MNKSELRKKARQRLKGNWGLPIGISFLSALISLIPSLFQSHTTRFINGVLVKTSSPSLISVLLQFALIPIGYGIIKFFIGFVREQEVGISTLFKGYKEYLRVFVTQLLMGLFIILWTLLLIIPGIIKSFSYSMSLYILNDNPDISAKTAINMSKDMMNGHKMDYFLLNLSFLGWILLSILSIGIGLLWVIPYIQTSKVYFYEEVKSEYMSKVI